MQVSQVYFRYSFTINLSDSSFKQLLTFKWYFFHGRFYVKLANALHYLDAAKNYILKGNKLLPKPIRSILEDPFSEERTWGARRQTGSHKSGLHCKLGGKSINCMQPPYEDVC